MAVAAALISSLSGVALPRDRLFFGEIGLSGAVRAVPRADQRLKEAERLGFRSSIAPAATPPDACPRCPWTMWAS